MKERGYNKRQLNRIRQVNNRKTNPRDNLREKSVRVKRNSIPNNKGRKKKIQKKSRRIKILPLILVITIFLAISYLYSNHTEESKVVKKYFELLEAKKYDEMYELVECDSSKEEFSNKLRNIYDGIEADNISVRILSNMIVKNMKDKINKKRDDNIWFKLSMKTIAGNVIFNGTAPVIKTEKGYKIKWNPSLILDNLKEGEKVRVRTIKSKRGTLYDRNGKVIAKDSSIYEIGIVPSKFAIEDVKQVAELLELNSNELKQKVDKADSDESDYVFLKKISKEEQDVKNALLRIKGILIGDADSRVYPFKESTSIMTGYVKDGDGKTGLEETFNEELKGKNGAEIYIEANGKIKEIVAKKEAVDGVDIKTTIDINVQNKIYDEFEDECGFIVSLDYNTGEVLALVSVPSYDANKFELGIAEEEWNDLQNDDKKPMFNRYLAAYTPGSTMKPIIGAIGMEKDILGKLEEDRRNTTRWQKDTSWKDFYVTTLEMYNEPVNLENALVYSDNIYFSKLALELGRENIENGLNDFGFNSDIDFEQQLSQSTYGKLDGDKTIATTGFGQANVMINPVLMASIYSAFANGGNMVKPYLRYEENEEAKTKYFKQSILTSEIADTIKEDLIEVVKRGSGKNCYIEDKMIAGKTGTAEIKKNQNDKNGTENGWFNSFDEYGNLYITMIENVKSKGGSKYVVEKMRHIYEE